MVRVAIIGVGHWGPNLLRNFSDHVDSEVVWVVDVNQQRLDVVRARFPRIRVSTDPLDAMDDVDAVVIATPTSSHYGLVSSALGRNKHVFVEKPLTGDPESARAVVELAKSTQRVLMVGHVFLYNPAVRWVKRFLESGEPGRVFYLSSQRTNFGPVRSDVGAAWDLASQDVAIFNYWLGKCPLSASASGLGCIRPGVEDFVFLTLRYQGPILAHVHVSWLHPRKTREIAVIGERRMLVYDDMNLSEPVRVYENGIGEQLGAQPGYEDTFLSFRSSVHVGAVRTPTVLLEEPLKVEVDHFLDCVLHGKEPVTSGEEGLKIIEILAAVQRSIANHGREEIIHGL
jgi:predicted dehydrogenase